MEAPPSLPSTYNCNLLIGEQPIFTTRAHVFQIDPTTKKNWVPASKQAVTVSYFYDSTRNSYRIISVDGEQPIFTTRAHVFQIDPTTKKNWVPASKQAVTVSYFYDSTRNSYRIISVDGSKVIINSTITPNMTFTKTSQKFGQWADSRANTVFGLGFASEQQLSKFAEKFQEVKEAAKMAREKSQEKTDATSIHSQYESELQALKESNVRLMEALQEANSSVEKWKTHTTACQEENTTLKNKIADLEAMCKEVNQEKERNAQLSTRVQKLENEIKDKEQAAELANQEARGRVSALQSEVSEGQQRQGAMKKELKKFMELLEGKIDELHEVRQGLSHLGMDN
ncbi:hypothetical protein PDJAM_G00218120 [Pangasius djambal]|uniref:Uncharacterized protein n=1 Tax=Pangasius djambal TaxID=1691987 RepID=A0ACC5YBB6_9TELE|nr:hypothetical protein [Pangasius djambal]